MKMYDKKFCIFIYSKGFFINAGNKYQNNSFFLKGFLVLLNTIILSNTI